MCFEHEHMSKGIKMRKALVLTILLALALGLSPQASANSASATANSVRHSLALNLAPAPVSLFAQRGGAGRPRLVKRLIRETNRKLKYTIDASYPQIAGAADASASQFNRAAKELMTGAVNDFKKDLEPPDSSTPPEIQQSSFDAGYSVAYSSPDLVSVSFGFSVYNAGAAHPNHYSATLNYDLKASRTLALSDLFNPRSGYLQAISAYAVKALKKELGPDPDTEWIGRGAGPSAENFKSWTITPRGLAINFDPYQVASYAQGEHLVVIPYAALRNVINMDGPLGPLAKKGRR
jgi:hypothetical protein